MTKSDQQHEVDVLRAQAKRQAKEIETLTAELAAYKSGSIEGKRIAESADFLAAERDRLKSQNERMAIYCSDLNALIRHYEGNTAPPVLLLGRISAWRLGGA